MNVTLTLSIDRQVVMNAKKQAHACEPFYHNALHIFSLFEKKIIVASVSSLFLWNMYYILSKYLGQQDALKK